MKTMTRMLIVWIVLTTISLGLPANVCIGQIQLIERDKLIEDIRQLADIIESSHPDPYSHGGGRIEFHRRLHRLLIAIPEGGMTRDDFIRLLRPFVAAVGDQHTEIYSGYPVDQSAPGGLPYVFGVIGKNLYVHYAIQEADRKYANSLLVSVEGVTTAELVERLSRLEGVENEYFALRTLARGNLYFRPYLMELIPEWTDTTKVTFELQLTNGEIETVVRSLPIARTGSLISLNESRINLPRTDSSGFLFDFIDPFENKQEVAYLRVDNMHGYREVHEMAMSHGRENHTPEEMAAFPSATETFRDMVVEMKKRGTRDLIIDIRSNGGGNFIMAPALVYFLWGKTALTTINLQNAAKGGGHIERYSPLYFEANPNMSLEEINAGRAVSLVMGDIDFSRIFTNVAQSDSTGKPKENPTRLKVYERATTFYAEYESETYSGYYLPENVLVLMTPWTSSSGLDFAVYLYKAGASLVGTPSAQPPNSWGNLLEWKLDNSGIEGEVSSSFDAEFPDDPERGRILPVHYPLTHEKYASYGFDQNASFLYAMEILGKLESQ